MIFSGKVIQAFVNSSLSVSYTHLRAHETLRYLVCRLLLEKKHELFSGIEDKQFFYFVHSFVALNTETSITTTHYGEEFVSSLATENIFATQFHPEKSGEIGLKFLENFINWKI